MKATAVSTVPTQRSDAGVLSPIVFWSVLGVIATLLSLSIFGQWLLSAEHFTPVPVTAADQMPGSGTLPLRIVEAISTAVMLWAFYHYLFKPWRRTGKAPIEGLLLVGALLSYFLDTTINYSGYFMAWNKHAFNFGTWGSFFPGHTGPTHYAEALLWGPPMYVYFGVALGTIQMKVIDVLRPRAGWLLALPAAFAAAFVFDLVAESAIIQFSQAYAWPSTIGALTVWAGEQYQFPLYESFLVAVYASMYTYLAWTVRERGLSFIETGVDRLPVQARAMARLLAATGFATLCTAIYFGAFYAISMYADTHIELPSYLMYAEGSWSGAPH